MHKPKNWCSNLAIILRESYYVFFCKMFYEIFIGQMSYKVLQIILRLMKNTFKFNQISQ